MKGKYIDLQIRLACLSKPVPAKKDIHAQLAETIEERKKVLQQLEDLSKAAKVIDVYLGDTKAA
jgi:hypothetical protein